MRTSKLTAQDRLIRVQLAEGRSRASIARDLGVPTSTLKSYLTTVQGGTAAQAPEVKRPTLDVSQEDMLRAEVRELKGVLAKGHKANVAQERILTAVESAVTTVDPALVNYQWYNREATRPPGKDKPHHRQLLMLSDFHGGEVVEPEAVNGLNNYSWQIMEDRVDELLAGLESHRKKSPDLTGIDVVFGGDMCSGANHQELAETNEYPLAEQGVKMGYLQGRIIEHIAERYDDVRVLAIVGNHPRLKVKPAAKRVHDNMDWVAAVVARQHTALLDNVRWTIPTASAAFWEIAGLTYYVFHGDGIRSSMPGVPWGGVTRRANEIRRAHASSGRRIDGFLLGHFHQANAMFDLGIFMNGALKGTDEWVLKNMGGGGRPSQLLLTFDESKHRMTDVRLLTPTAGLEL